MAGNNAIQFLRGTSSQISSSTQVALAGQPVYDLTNNYLYIGDGTTQIKNLTAVKSSNADNATTAGAYCHCYTLVPTLEYDVYNLSTNTSKTVSEIAIIYFTVTCNKSTPFTTVGELSDWISNSGDNNYITSTLVRFTVGSSSYFTGTLQLQGDTPILSCIGLRNSQIYQLDGVNISSDTEMELSSLYII